MRELGAREALQCALSQHAHFVVLDICGEHATEFSRDEVQGVLDSHGQAAPPRRLGPRGVADPKAPPAGGAARPRLAEIDMPFRRLPPASKPPAVVEELLVPRSKRGAARPDPRAEPEAGPARRQALAAVPLATRPANMARRPRPAARGEPDPAPTIPDLAAWPQAPPDAPAAEPIAAPPAPALEAVQPASPHPGFEAVQPAPPHPGFEAVQPAPPHPGFEAVQPAPPPQGFEPLPPLEGLPPELPPAAASAFGDAVSPFADPSPEPEAKPAALEAAVMVTQIGKLAADEATQQAAADVAAMLTDMARKGRVEDAPPPEPSVVKTLAGMFAAELNADAQRGKRGTRTKGPTPAPEPEAEAAAAPAAAPAGASTAFRALEPPLSDAVLDRVSEALRGYPEVEWACEVGDGSAMPVIGIRVDPGFAQRAPEIKSAVAEAAAKHGAKLTVMLLGDPQQMREARAAGNAFFPWRKRAKR